MNIVNKFGFGVGHVLNDLVAAMWFSYLLVFLNKVLGLDTYWGGIVILVGQLADGIATPLVGLESDYWASRPRANPVKARKLWHLAGSICVAATFPFLFMKCIVCTEHVSTLSFLIFYIPLVVIFQFGWAATQVSHLSLIPELAVSRSDNVQLNSVRYGATVCSNLVVFGLTWLIFGLADFAAASEKVESTNIHVVEWNATTIVLIQPCDADFNTTDKIDRNNVTPNDAPRFLLITGVLEAVGIVSTVLFQIFTSHGAHSYRDDPPKARNYGSITENTRDGATFERSARLNWHLWLKRLDFYMIALIYMGTRLYINVTSVYLPLYVLDSLHLNNTAIAYAPLALYVASLVVSVIIKPLLDRTGNRISFVAGCLLALAACALIYFCSQTWFQATVNEETEGAIAFPVIGLSLLIGTSSALLYVTALATISELIGQEKSSGAFVFGAMSLTDKIANGVVIAIIQTYHPCVKNALACSEFYVLIMALVPGVSIAVALVADLVLLAISSFSRQTHTRLHDLADEGASVVHGHSALPVESRRNSFSSHSALIVDGGAGKRKQSGNS